MTALADLIDAHRGAFEHDWRARFHVPLRAIGESMTWGEALRQTEQLATDPASHVGAALSGWDYPLSREALATLDLIDLTHEIAWAQGGGKGSRPKPCVRPWTQTQSGRRKVKPDESLTQAEIIAALRAAGHTAPLPQALEAAHG